jgi:kojibiose phosphorylase
MLMALLPDAFPLEVQAKNFEFYEARCGHGSSLSPPIHAMVAARLGRDDAAERYFRQSAAIDLDDSMGNSAAGLHMAALGGLWQAAVSGFGGVTAQAEGLAFRPHLPQPWRRLRFPLRWRGRRLTVDISRDPGLLQVSLLQGRPMNVQAGGAWQRLERGRPVSASLEPREEGA